MGDPPGSGWDESGGSDAYELIEFYLDSNDESFPANGLRTLGASFNPSVFGAGNIGDVVFEYGGPNGYVIQGPVYNIVCSCGLADYNLDGYVNAADYTVYRNHKSGIYGGPLPNEGVTPGQTTYEDYLFWKANYTGGPTFAGGASNSIGSDVPEPATLALLLCGLLAGLAHGRRGVTARSIDSRPRINGERRLSAGGRTGTS
jgi:hypothetical protein